MLTLPPIMHNDHCHALLPSLHLTCYVKTFNYIYDKRSELGDLPGLDRIAS